MLGPTLVVGRGISLFHCFVVLCGRWLAFQQGPGVSCRRVLLLLLGARAVSVVAIFTRAVVGFFLGLHVWVVVSRRLRKPACGVAFTGAGLRSTSSFASAFVGVPAALAGKGLVIPTEPCSRVSPPYSLQLGTRCHRSSLLDGRGGGLYVLELLLLPLLPLLGLVLLVGFPAEAWDNPRSDARCSRTLGTSPPSSSTRYRHVPFHSEGIPSCR
ncbi:hypothetical protein Taro_021169 [Colocasia esculenta]|uniref:Uncharacterized protein n=1 Tax=Colocasia esculenta TaxID=4460 RepID=A0A843UY98_COLES|nr:hypothetical protein [Colocasia esculenta]